MFENDAFEGFPKIARLNRQITITEKLDGTNAQILIGDSGDFKAGSRTQWLGPGKDNYGFYAWCIKNQEELLKLGPGRHFGEWWGAGIQRRYNVPDKRFWLFNTARWNAEKLPACVGVVPVLYAGVFDQHAIKEVLKDLEVNGSKAAPGFMQPEGVVIWHEAAQQMFKMTIANDGVPKGTVGVAPLA